MQSHKTRITEIIYHQKVKPILRRAACTNVLILNAFINTLPNDANYSIWSK